MKVYLSHGLGVNSWALYLYLIEQGEVPGVDFEAVAVNHHTDWPESYEYLEMMLAKGYPVTVIEPDVGGIKSLYEYCLKRSIIPARIRRWCTVKFKIGPLEKYQEKPCVVMLGIDAGESHRAKMHEQDGITYDYPLVEAGIDRQGCIEIIRRHGLPVPPKSGCFICPYQRRSQWIELRDKHPELFCKAKGLEELSAQKRIDNGKVPIYYKDMPLEQYLGAKDRSGRLPVRGQESLWDDDPPCRCGL